ncbi:MAG: class I SAM-dependent methyltransferase, partial [Gemmatimonadota bacterium]
CGMAWLDSAPLLEPHGEGYFTHTDDAGQLRNAVAPPTLVRATLARRLGYAQPSAMRAAWLLERLPAWSEHCESYALFLPANPTGRLLDVGCGNGVFAARMRLLGWDVTGIEPDARTAAIARDVFGLNVHASTLEDANLPGACFDAITLSHVIEHVPDPVGTLAECRRLLRPGGTLIAATPNLRSLGRRTFGASWMHWDVPRHRYVFSPSSLSEVARRAGLRTVEARSSARAARWAWRRSRELRHDGMVVETNGGRARGATAIAFGMVETLLTKVHDAGEECLLVATA